MEREQSERVAMKKPMFAVALLEMAVAALPASALTIAAPSCIDENLMQQVTFITGSADGIRLLGVGTEQAETLVLVDCPNQRMLEVLNPEHQSPQQKADIENGVIYLDAGVDARLREAVESEAVYTFGELRRILRTDGYQVVTGKYNKAPCGCGPVPTH